MPEGDTITQLQDHFFPSHGLTAKDGAQTAKRFPPHLLFVGFLLQESERSHSDAKQQPAASTIGTLLLLIAP